MDGNFSAEHMAMRDPDNDVALADGTAFMVGKADYKAHLSAAVEDQQVCFQAGILHGRADFIFPEVQMQQSQSRQSSKCKSA